MSTLPAVPYGSGIRKWGDVKWGGYMHTAAAGDGDIYDMQNMSSDRYPLLTPRKKRYQIAQLTRPNGIYCHDGVYWVDGTGFYKDGTYKGTVSSSAKRFTSIGDYIVILPDKKYYNVKTDVMGSLEATATQISVIIGNGTYAGQPAENNTIAVDYSHTSQSFRWSDYFKDGDAVEISGAVRHPENNKTIIIREVAGDDLRFYENSFVTSTGSETETLTLRRTMPDLEFICENSNRLWGCKGDTIYASKLGDPFNWNVFDGLTTDSYAADVGSAGDFTGCYSYLGYPCFFKEENIYKVYGDRPSNYQVMGSASLGTAKGSGDSFGIAGETLFYMARSGIVAYTGGMPTNCAEAFGEDRYSDAVGGSDGIKYYVSMKKGSTYTLFVFDTRSGVWEKEDNLQIVGFGWNEELYLLDSSGKLWLGGNPREIPMGATAEGTITSIVEFADMTAGNANKKGTGKVQIRAELAPDATLQVNMQFDSDGIWRNVSTLQNTTGKKKSYYLPIVPRRSDHYKIKLTGTGEWTLYSLMREEYSGSPY